MQYNTIRNLLISLTLITVAAWFLIMVSNTVSVLDSFETYFSPDGKIEAPHLVLRNFSISVVLLASVALVLLYRLPVFWSHWKQSSWATERLDLILVLCKRQLAPHLLKQ